VCSRRQWQEDGLVSRAAASDCLLDDHLCVKDGVNGLN